MNLLSATHRNLLFVLASVVAILLIYFMNPYKLSYQLQRWKEFGETPIRVSHVLYFIKDTPDVIGYRDPGSGKKVSCGSTVAYIATASNETYRCCDTGTEISCLAGDFRADIPVFDEQCIGYLRQAFGFPASLPNTQDYRIFGSCSGAASSLTVAQINDRGQILWKAFNISSLNRIRTLLRCILAPLLLVAATWLVIARMRAKTHEPIPRF